MPAELTQTEPLEISRKASAWIGAVAVLFFGLILAGAASSRWELWQKLLHRTDFGLSDPLFQRDFSFYVFVLPFYSFLKGWSLWAVVLTIAIVALLYLFSGNITYVDKKLKVSTRATRHLLFLALLILLLVLGQPALLRAGVPACVNSDDPNLFGIDLVNEYEACMKEMGLSEGDLQEMNLAALRHSFLPAEITGPMRAVLAQPR